ncbi:LysR family transcriptional regulator [Clostridium saccharobutylicum]|uniref:HTH-type transcriptional regulator CynR n=1 Tax=Clostridium saccharobutylicum TaxID=169679 RepID=A0A1S8MP17_CLOSA|nr:LysR family transcriptional regulator [Clostridium saccharobutylicum]OOM05933.1 HTH-type transcriptional regulator CynR [Clostridium saccharobutylicum]
MNIKELINFLKICEMKSISKASKELFISPQGLSKSMKKLEKELGASLFIRSSSGMSLTKQGEILKKNAIRIIQDLEKLKYEMYNATKFNKEKIKLVSSYGVIRLLEPECILEFNKNNTNISLEYEEHPDMYIDEYVKENKVDIGFAIEPIDDAAFNKTVIKTFDIKLLVHKDHPLSKKKVITYKDIDNVDMVIESKAFKVHHILDEHFKQAGVEPNIIFVTSGFSLCHKLCAENKCISITMDFISRDMKNNDIVAIPFEDKSLKWTICMITKKGHISSTIKTFEDYILSWINHI